MYSWGLRVPLVQYTKRLAVIIRVWLQQRTNSDLMSAATSLRYLDSCLCSGGCKCIQWLAIYIYHISRSLLFPYEHRSTGYGCALKSSSIFRGARFLIYFFIAKLTYITAWRLLWNCAAGRILGLHFFFPQSGRWFAPWAFPPLRVIPWSFYSIGTYILAFSWSLPSVWSAR